MKQHEPRLYRSPINLAPRKSGPISIRHVNCKDRVTIVSAREAFTRGTKPIFARLTQPLRVHELVQENVGIWMTDHPQELNQIGEMLHDLQPHGNVCVGGLGLGVVAETVTKWKGVRSVTVVELNEHVVRLCHNEKAGYKLVQGDILNFLRRHEGHFDFYLLDTWQGTNEATWWETVLPLRRAIRNRFGPDPKVHCWAEDQMAGQVMQRLIDPRNQEHWFYRKPWIHMNEEDAVNFLARAGMPDWERKYGAEYNAIISSMARERMREGAQ